MRKRLLNIGVTITIIFFATLMLFFSAAYKKDNNIVVPIMKISLADSTLEKTISESKDIKYTDNIISITNDNSTTTYGKVELKGRGNSTWGWPKSPFQIKFETKVGLFGMNPSKTWILLANYLDKTNLRNDIAFQIEQMLGQNYAFHGQFIELYIDNNYQGLYYLTEKPEIDKNRIDLKNELGILVELDNLHTDMKPCDAMTEQYSCLNIKDLRNKDKAEESFNSFTDQFEKLEKAATEKKYSTIENLIDVDSFAKYFVLSEFTVNPDAYSSSLFFYKDGPDDLIHVAPGWDFDLSLGNPLWIWPRTENFYLPETTRIVEKYAFGGIVYDEPTDTYVDLAPDRTISTLLYHLYSIPEFKSRVKYIYRHHLMNNREKLIDYLHEQKDYIYDSAIRDRALWRENDSELLEKLGEKSNERKESIIKSSLTPEEIFNYDVDQLVDWLTRRFDHFDREYSGFDELPEAIKL